MSPEVRERVFEPFFTTKEVGKGSGLGLSQVYGFVRQSEGEVELETAVGEGACFRLLLPGSSAAEQPVKSEATPQELMGGSEKILLVDDDLTVLAVTLDIVTSLGYQVTTATNASEALAIIHAGAAIDLLFTDVVMPGGVSGVSLARTARELRPGLRVLLTSGFVDDGQVMEGSEFPLLDKPYETAHLASMLRKLLDGGDRRPRRGRPQAAAAE